MATKNSFPAFCFATFAFFAANPLHAAAAPTTIPVGYPQLNGGQTPLWNIADSKIDVKYHLDIKPVYIPDVARGFLKAMVAGLRLSIEQPEISKRAIGKYLASKDQEIIDEAYRSFAQLFPRVPYVTDDAIRAALSVTDHPKAATANPKDFYDNRFLQELESSRFVKEIYAGK